MNARLSEEGRILRKLRHANIVELYDQTEMSGHVALFMAVAGVDTKSGAYTLAQRLRLKGRLSLDFLQPSDSLISGFIVFPPMERRNLTLDDTRSR